MQVFLSYSHLDEEVVKVLADCLQLIHRDIWFDSHLDGGEIWWNAILKNILQSDVFIFALSDSSLASKACRLELDYAIDLNRPVLPVRAGLLSTNLANPIADRHVIDFDPRDARSGSRLVATIETAARRENPRPDPLPIPPLIPFAYLRAVGQQIDSVELSLTQQQAVLDTLHRALREESDERTLGEVLSMLHNLLQKPYLARQTERDTKALLIAYGDEHLAGDDDPGPVPELPTPQPVKPPPDEPVIIWDDLTGPASGTSGGRRPETAQAPPPVVEPPDPVVWLLERLDRIARQASTAPNFVAEKAPEPVSTPPPVAEEDWSGRLPWGHWGEPGGTSASESRPPTPEGTTSGTTTPSQTPSLPASSSTPTTLILPTSVHSPEQPAGRPPDHRILSVVSLLGPPFGFLALYYSLAVDRSYRAGQLEAARRASGRAYGFALVGAILGTALLNVLVAMSY